MRSVHVPFGYFPDPSGGTEVYVSALVAALNRAGDHAVVAAPGADNHEYDHHDVHVYRMGATGHVTPAEMYGGGLARVAARFAEVLDRERPDVVHLHAFTPAVSIRLVREAARRHVPVVFTYHTPTASCVKGTLMRQGTACDGRLDVQRCTACSLEARGLPPFLAHVASRVPPLPLTPGDGPFRRVWSTAGYATLVASLHAAVRALLDEADAIVAPRGWVRDLLRLNGVPASKIVLSPQPLCHDVPPRDLRPRVDGPLRIAFLGRLDPTKGVDVLLRAMRLVPDTMAMQVDIYGVVEAEGGREELARLRALAGNDARVAFHAAVPPADVLRTLSAHDVLAVPSQWMETGPLVALEAAAAGVAVVASRLGGLAELVDDGVSGALVTDYASPDAWASTLVALATDPARTRALGALAAEPRRMTDVAAEMSAVYAALVAATPKDGRA